MLSLLQEKFASFFAPLLPLLVSDRLSCMFVSSRLSILQNSNREEQTQGQNNEVKPCSQTEPDSSGRMYNNNVATSKDNEAYVAGQPYAFRYCQTLRLLASGAYACTCG
jgi:hypothetical protein